MTTPLTTTHHSDASTFPPPPQKLGRQIPSCFTQGIPGMTPQVPEIFGKSADFFPRNFLMPKLFFWAPFTGDPNAKIIFLSTQRPPTAQKISSPVDDSRLRTGIITVWDIGGHLILLFLGTRNAHTGDWSYNVHSLFACYRYVILDWQNGSSKLQHRQLLAFVVGQLLTWHQKCLEIPLCLEQSNTMSIVLASYCGNCCRDRSHSKLVNVAGCICWN